MKKYITPLRVKSRRAVVARVVSCISLIAPISVCSFGVMHAEVETELDELIVSAVRMPREPADVTAAVSQLEPEELEKRGVFTLREALNESPGVIATSTGGETGALGSLFIRGTNTAYSQLVVDGMRLSDSTTPMGSMLGASRVFDLGRMEILRGAQGAAYGGESIGGVLYLETARGTGDPSGTWFAEAGSFDSFSTGLRFQGAEKGLSYFLSAGYEETDNDFPNQEFNQASTALRLEQDIGKGWQLGVTYRGVDAYYNNRGNSDDHLDASLVTLYLQGKINDAWRTQTVLGFQQEFYDSDSQYGNYGTDMRATALSSDHDLTLRENLHLLWGVFGHRSDFQNTIGTDAERDRYGAHAALEWKPLPAWQTYAALRWEDYAAYGEEETWRLGSSYEIKATQTIVRAGLGTSFRAPSYLDLFGSSFGAGNPNLHAESAQGWDIGIEQRIGDDHRIELTFFRNEIEDRIDSFADPRPVNLDGEAVSSGFELGAKGRFFHENVSYRLAMTYLDKSLSDQPREHWQSGLDWQVTPLWQLGVGLHALSDHSWGGNALDGYAIGRLHTSYQVRENIRLHARWENFTDEEYFLSDFSGDAIPGSGSALYGGVTLEW